MSKKISAGVDKVVELLYRIGQEQHEIAKLQEPMNKKIEGLRKRITILQTEAIDAVALHEKEVSRLGKNLAIFMESHRDELTEGGKTKTVKLSTGKIWWRATPRAVSFDNSNSVVEVLETLGLPHLIRVIKEPDKKALLEEPEVSEGVEVVFITWQEELKAEPVEGKAITLKVTKCEEPKKFKAKKLGKTAS